MPRSDLKVYVIDDDVSILKSMKRLLRSDAYDVETFSNGEEFLDSTRPNQNGCVVLDVQMPVNGMTLMKQIINVRPSMKIILMTAHEDQRLRTTALKSGVSYFLYKPFHDQKLLDAVKGTLAGPVTPGE